LDSWIGTEKRCICLTWTAWLNTWQYLNFVLFTIPHLVESLSVVIPKNFWLDGN